MKDILDAFESEIDTGEILATVEQFKVSATQYIKFVGIFIFGILLISSLAHFLLGKKAQLNKAVSTAVEIFFVYVINTVICALGLELQSFMTPLPFVTMVEDYLVFYPILSAEFTDACQHVLKLLIIAFLVNMINEVIPTGKGIFSWFLLRFITVVASVAAIYGLELLLNMYLPQGFADIAPTILLCILIALVLLGALKLLVGTVLTFLDPICGAMYTFFFSNFVGRALAKSLVSTALLTGLLVALNYLGISVVYVAASALTAYIPLMLIVLALWYVVGRIL